MYENSFRNDIYHFLLNKFTFLYLKYFQIMIPCSKLRVTITDYFLYSQSYYDPQIALMTNLPTK